MKKIIIDCVFGGQTAPFSFYIGDPEPKNHPIQFQTEWLSKHRGGSVPPEVTKSLQDLYDLSRKNNVSFEELCAYALEQNEEEEHSGAAEA